MSESLHSVATNIWILELDNIYFFYILDRLIRNVLIIPILLIRNWGLDRAKIA